ncbi:short-chain dehydrogenase/reductase SDR [Labilithrix luteola]|uniref:Short-chain dehydrogenase/reductase SDR n=1 Tax=Labilithrix luteola TaxID=1391654 RepID=A0A0K1QDX1_9BACT|nr:SDR family oxidoreductase [Labilithrix luteola]AKV03959.1 short-chain dehydrogenase/reductase SDR [Labilithrix luteola]
MQEGGVAIVTGGASGIGRALCEALGKRRFDVVVADRQHDLAEAVAADICKRGPGRARAASLDVRDFAAFERLAKDTVSRFGRIDYLFNNAGIAVGGEMLAYEVTDWTDVIDVNLVGVTNGIQAVYPRMVEQRSGHIVNTASVAGLIPSNIGSYTATKFAVVGLSKALRLEGKFSNVRCSVICPGPIRTPILTGGKFGRNRIPGFTDEMAEAMWRKSRPMDVDVFVERILPQVFADKGIIIEPKIWRAVWLLERLAPSLGETIAFLVLKKVKADMQKMTRAAAQQPRTGHTRSNAGA